MDTLRVNGETRSLAGVAPDTPLLWVLRDELGLTATKFGCGVAACGACTVHLNGEATRCCVLPVSAVQAPVTTMEGLQSDPLMQRLQAAWLRMQVPQCGYCQTGMLMAAHALLRSNPRPDDVAIDAAITNLCRCGTYGRIRAAIRWVASA
ncbi:MAG: (2Fe-2S)-binding protein [Burkholderiales bacterium]|uniref:(2Fe-2S)-binding protein n=1 Tax=Inhella sp. TaxID=1921806 RepID=UPI001AC907A8|nr:(2Fe-2S)-binding protein [Burkholderiales bacterium]